MLELDTKADSTALQALAQATAQDLVTGLQASAQQLAGLAADVALLGQSAARASAAVLSYTAGRVTGVTETVDGTPRVTAITYDGAGRVKTISYPVPGGKTRTETYSYNADGVFTGMTAVEAVQ